MTVGIHPVREALRAGQPLDKVLMVKGAAGPRLQEIIELCRAQSVPIRFEARTTGTSPKFRSARFPLNLPLAGSHHVVWVTVK